MVTKGNTQLLITNIPDDLITREKLEASEEKRIVVQQVPLDLSGAAEEVILFHAEDACTLLKLTVVYPEASSADAGVTLTVGNEANAVYYYTGTSETGKAQWGSTDLTLLQTAVAAGDSVRVNSAGGKVGAGEVVFVIEYYVN